MKTDIVRLQNQPDGPAKTTAMPAILAMENAVAASPDVRTCRIQNVSQRVTAIISMVQVQAWIAIKKHADVTILMVESDTHLLCVAYFEICSRSMVKISSAFV